MQVRGLATDHTANMVSAPIDRYRASVVGLLKLSLFLVFAIGAALSAWQMSRIRDRMNAPSASGRCIACDSADLEVLAQQAYRCRDCGYEGGEGMRVLAEQKAAAVYMGLDPQERQRRARIQVRHALHTLMGVPSEGVGDEEEINRWSTGVEETALRGANELEEAARAAGGVVDLPGFGELDAGSYARMLREKTDGGSTVKQTRATLGTVEWVRDTLTEALRNVPADQGGEAQGYRS